MTISRTALLLALNVWAGSASADEPRPAITIRLDHPDRQILEVINLFQGSRVPHPAAALAGWKRATREPNRLGKPIEALVASINPSMAGELRSLDQGEVSFWFEPIEGQLEWGASTPNDDGTFAAMATAMALSGGAAQESMDGLAVDRLGPPGAALMAQGARTLLAGSSIDALRTARARLDRRPMDRDRPDRIRLKVEPRALDGSRSLNVRRLGALLGQAIGPITGSIGLDRSTIRAELTAGGLRPTGTPSIDPGWLDWLPIGRSMAAIAFAIDPSPPTWDAAFRVADLVEKLDPALANVAPIRLRLDLFARSAGIRLDDEIFPHLRGVAGWIGSDGRSIDGACLMLHLDDPAIAAVVAARVKRVGELKANQAADTDPVRWLGQLAGRTLRISSIGPSVVLTWGEGVMGASIEARKYPGRSARAAFLAGPVDINRPIVAAIWPSRIPGVIADDTPIAEALAGSPPMIWTASWQSPETFQLEGVWTGLELTVRRFLALIPLDPPPDH